MMPYRRRFNRPRSRDYRLLIEAFVVIEFRLTAK